jgi:hypothetical protein
LGECGLLWTQSWMERKRLRMAVWCSRDARLIPFTEERL